MSEETKLKQSQLKQYQALPLKAKVRLSEMRIHEWYEAWEGKVYVAFSGGKDSTAMLHIIRSLYPSVPAVFSDTDNELNSILEFVKTYGDAVTWVKPKMSFEEVLEKHGYPLASKKVCRFVNDMKRPEGSNDKTKKLRMTGITSKGTQAPTQKLPKKWMPLIDAPFNVTSKCCGYLKIQPTKPYEKETGRVAFVGTMASESESRMKSYLHNGGCNAFTQSDPVSRPLMFWTDQDVLEYLKTYNVPYADCYGKIVKDINGEWTTTGEKRTGCKLCLFGVHLEKGENRIQRLARTEPESYRHAIEDLGYDKVMDFIGVDWKPINNKKN